MRPFTKLASVALAALAALVILPLLYGMAHPAPPPPAPAPLHGAVQGAVVRYRAARVGDILADIAATTGFRAVAAPDTAARVYSGELAIADNGHLAAQSLAAKTGLVLRRGGPHWVLMPASD